MPSYKLEKQIDIYNSVPKIIDYDINLFPFGEIIAQSLEVDLDDLINLHKIKNHELQKLGSDQNTIWHKRYYAKQNDQMIPMVKKFVTWIKDLFNIDGQLIFQKKPTFRIHEVGNLGVGAWHRDRDYNHDTNEVNIWVPLTPTYDTNTIWTETEVYKEDFQPMELSYGQFLLFDGANLMHGNKINNTKTTRVSFDLRIIPIEKYRESGKDTVNKQERFEIGSYFDVIE